MEANSRHNVTDPEHMRHRPPQTESAYSLAAPPEVAGMAPATLAGLLGHPALSGRGNGPLRAAAALSLQQTRGNRAVQRLLQPSSDGAALTSDEDLGQRIAARQGGGSHLPPATQAHLEGGLNADLGHVRVHTDYEADQLSRSVQAIAFTTGSDIFFRSGMYNPESPEGLRLLAHESTHTLQQAAGPVAGTEVPGRVAISDPADSFEQAADAAATQVVSSAGTAAVAPLARFAVAGSLSPAAAGRAVQRDEEEEQNPGAGISAGGDLLKILGETQLPGAELIKATGAGMGAGVKAVGGMQDSSNPLPWIGAAGDLLDVAGVPGAGMISDFTDVASGVKEGTEGKPMGWVDAAQKMALGTAEMGGFELSEAAGLSVLGSGEGTLAGAAAAGELGTMSMLGPAAAVAGAGIAGWKAGELLSEHTAAGPVAESTVGLMDKGVTSVAQSLGIMEQGEGKSALLSATEWAGDHPVAAALTSPLWAPAALAGGLAVGGVGALAGVGDLENRALHGLGNLGGQALHGLGNLGGRALDWLTSD